MPMPVRLPTLFSIAKVLLAGFSGSRSVESLSACDGAQFLINLDRFGQPREAGSKEDAE